MLNSCGNGWDKQIENEKYTIKVPFIFRMRFVETKNHATTQLFEIYHVCVDLNHTIIQLFEIPHICVDLNHS